MERITPSIDLESRRMELRGMVKLASEVIALYWPMRTFVHHNPLHGLEYFSFEEAVRRGNRFMGANGYLSNQSYRAYMKAQRITLAHIDTALKPLVQDKRIDIGLRQITHAEVLRACLIEDLDIPVVVPLDVHSTDLSQESAERIATKLEPVMTFSDQERRISAMVECDQTALGRWHTLSHWCDSTLGTSIVGEINNQLIKWCEAFLDEGHATWPMPGREQGLYGAWKALATHEWFACEIPNRRIKIAQLPDRPEDVILECLDALGIPPHLRQDYVSLQLTALPGWVGFIKWRAEQRDYPWQQAYPASLVKYLAIRLWYARELVHTVCQDALGIEGRYDAVTAYMRTHSEEYFLRRQRVAGRLPEIFAEEVDHLAHQKRNGWKRVLERYRTEVLPYEETARRLGAARRLLALARSLEIPTDTLLEISPSDLKQVVDWIDAFPESDHGPVWLKAFEAGYQENLLGSLQKMAPQSHQQTHSHTPVRPYSQSVYCIDVRSEPFRRHLESVGPHETFGFAGFFAAFIRFRAWGKNHDTDQFPVIMHAKNEVREIPRSYISQMVSRHTNRTNLVEAGYSLLHDLKENAVTPYVMVETLGWFYGLPLFGKTLMPSLYRRIKAWCRGLFLPSLATTLTLAKLAPAEAEEMLVAEQHAVVKRALREHFGRKISGVTPAFVEALRQHALNREEAPNPALVEAANHVGLSVTVLKSFIVVLQRDYDFSVRSQSRKREHLTRRGFTLEEQILTVDTALRMMGLTKNFARLVLFCAHGSTSDNNPYESALDCGACGGNEGKPNARLLAMMANNPRVREGVATLGIGIPSDTHFLAGQIDTTTDQVLLFDLEDVPPTHRADVTRLQEHLKEAGDLTSRERVARFPDIVQAGGGTKAEAEVQRRSGHWCQIRPEWGLSGNTAFIVGRRALTKNIDLGGRVFLHSYDYREDPNNRLLEVLLTAPQVVAQWINMEHYFSTVNNEVYGSGSKVYHNVVGRLGIMSGPWSDLRLGLARQTVMNGEVPYHEPMRLTTIIESPRGRIDELISRHEVLQHYYHNEWVHLIALDPEDGVVYRYRPTGDWRPITDQPIHAIIHR